MKPDYEQKYQELEKFCNQLTGKYESLQNDFNDILGEKQELKKTLVDQIILSQKLQETNDHNSKLIKPLVDTLEEKDKEIQEKDDGIQERIKKIQEKDNTIQEMIKTIQEKDNLIQDLEREKSKFNEQKIRELESRNKEYEVLLDENKSLNETLKEKINEIQRKDKEIQKIQSKDEEIQDSNQKITKFRDEAATGYQSALGNANNLRISDDNENNSVTLKDDILKLQDSLDDYITKCKSNVEINISEVQKLLKTYGIRTTISEQDQNKLLIRAVLQRHVIEKIFTYAREYFGYSNPDAYPKFKSGIETNMYKKTKELVELVEAFARKRDGIDETTKVLPIKLRQQVYSALGNRGFNDFTIENKRRFTHEFIKIHQRDLNEEIGKYRKLKDLEKKREIENMAGDIIKKVVTLFWFRIKAQEPVADFFWFKSNNKIDPSCMEGKWEDDDIDNIVVDVCYFPLIGNESTRQIYTLAKIFHISKKSPSYKNYKNSLNA